MRALSPICAMPVISCHMFPTYIDLTGVSSILVLGKLLAFNNLFFLRVSLSSGGHRSVAKCMYSAHMVQPCTCGG